MASPGDPKWLAMSSVANSVVNSSHSIHGIPQQDAAIMDLELSYGDAILGSDVIYTNGSRYDLIHNEMVQTTFCILYFMIFVLGVVGNVLVCFVVFRNRAMQTVTNLFITNLALSDILLCFLAVPFTPMYTFTRGWVFGTILCHLVPYAQGCSVYISTLTLTSIAIDRFFVIIYPFHPRMRLATCIYIIVSIWGFSLLATLPYGLYMKVFAMNHTGVWQNYCEEDWPSEQYRKIFGSFNSTLQFVLPFLIISICYTCVSVKLNDRARTKPGSKTSRREAADRDRKKRTNRMLISMVAVFGISWLPLNVVNIFNDFYARTEEWRFYNVIFLFHIVSQCPQRA
uniref:G-protein coupled receptors family 1 profile domain-containing protein n=1 Tax=Lutzomyia longipalpis TaxID=7200 RepID=A0A1B0CY22_LUTLO